MSKIVEHILLLHMQPIWENIWLCFFTIWFGEISLVGKIFDLAFQCILNRLNLTSNERDITILLKLIDVVRHELHAS